MANQNVLKAIPLANLPASGFTGSYMALNTLPNPCSLLYFINNANKDVTVSYDGVNDHDYIPTMTIRELPAQAAAQPNSKMALFAQGTTIYIKGTVGTGNVYLAGYFTPVTN